MPAKFPINTLEDLTKVTAQSLRWRWRNALVTASQLIEGERRNSGTEGPLTDQEKAILNDVLLSIEDQARDQVGDHAGTMFANGVFFASLEADKPKFVWKQPTQEEIAEIKSSPRFVDNVAMDFATEYMFEQVKSKDESEMSVFRTVLLETLEQGNNPKVAAKIMSERLKNDLSSWETIARTEGARAVQIGFNEQAKAIGSEIVFVPAQTSACKSCKAMLSGRIFNLDDLEGASNYGKKASERVPCIPMHPNCTCVAIPAAQSLIESTLKHHNVSSVPKSGLKAFRK